MLFAALGDVHGNWPALRVVLEDIDRLGIETIVHTGDLVGGRPWPNEVVAELHARDIPGVQGESDRRTLRFLRKERGWRERLSAEDYAVYQAAFEACRSTTLEYLRSLPRKRLLTVDGVTIAVCHGTLASQSESLDVDAPTDRFRRQRELEPSARIIVCGRTHRHYARFVDDVLFINPGAVGVESDAAYAVVSTETDPWQVEFRRLDYNTEL